jgi:hypothetical protein
MATVLNYLHRPPQAVRGASDLHRAMPSCVASKIDQMSLPRGSEGSKNFYPHY